MTKRAKLLGVALLLTGGGALAVLPSVSATADPKPAKAGTWKWMSGGAFPPDSTFKRILLNTATGACYVTSGNATTSAPALTLIPAPAAAQPGTIGSYEIPLFGGASNNYGDQLVETGATYVYHTVMCNTATGQVWIYSDGAWVMATGGPN
jgi:hypothetical protein